MPAPDGSLEERLEALDREGARSFDGPGLRFIEALVERSRAHPGGAADRLRARAQERLEELARRLHAARESAGAEPAAPARRARRRSPEEARAAATRYQASFAELATDLRVERSRASLPIAPGPYNGEDVAARLLEAAAELSPLYAHAQLERMRELAVLARLPAPSSGKPRRKKR